MPITVDVSAGELLDKIAILQIKAERIADIEKVSHVGKELESLAATRERCVPNLEALGQLTTELQSINEMLWDVENELRHCERNAEFGPRFTELARCVYRFNDRRAAIKRQIDDLVGAPVREQKCYTAYE